MNIETLTLICLIIIIIILIAILAGSIILFFTISNLFKEVEYIIHKTSRDIGFIGKVSRSVFSVLYVVVSKIKRKKGGKNER